MVELYGLVWLGLAYTLVSLLLTPFKPRSTFGFGGSSRPAGYTTVQQTRDPWSAQQAPLTRGFERAETIFGQPRQDFPYSRVVPFSPATETALTAQENRAVLGNPLNLASQKQFGDVLGGTYLQGENPAWGSMVDRIQGRVLPAVASQFSEAGRYGSGAHAEASARAMADAVAPLAYQNYEKERARQMQAAQLGPQLATGDYFDIAQQREVGAARERQAGAQIQEDIARFQFPQEEPRQRLSDYMAQVAGGTYGGGQTTTSPYYANPLATGLGTASKLVDIAGSLWGQGGIWS